MHEAHYSGSGAYVVKVKSHMDARQSYWFEEMTITAGFDDDGQPITTLTGRLADQAALQGVLARIRDMNLTLISVNPVVTEAGSETDEIGE